MFFQMALMIVLGIILRKKRIIDERTQGSLSEILLKAVLPFTIISSSQYEYSTEMVKSIIAVACCSSAYYIVTLLILRQTTMRLPFDDSEKRVFVTTSVFANTGFVGFPLMYGLFGDSGLLLASIYNLMYNLFFYTYGVHLISKKTGNFKDIFFNPVSIASVAAVVLFIVPWRMPSFVKETTDLIGNMTVPLSMIILGSTFATVDIRKLFMDKKSYIVTCLRLIVFPLAMLGALMAASRFIEVNHRTMITLTIMTALPSGAMNVIFSERFNCAPKFCARTVVMTLVFMVVTLPLLIGLCLKFLLG
ncbi:MAG: AEC family transporter [Clostridiales bacterium]|nr:AEC family transporter [Clostridiales bacterium]MBR6484789.1 AEC family transporter [Clostridiales bacterium]